MTFIRWVRKIRTGDSKSDTKTIHLTSFAWKKKLSIAQMLISKAFFSLSVSVFLIYALWFYSYTFFSFLSLSLSYFTTDKINQ